MWIFGYNGKSKTEDEMETEFETGGMWGLYRCLARIAVGVVGSKPSSDHGGLVVAILATRLGKSESSLFTGACALERHDR